MLILARLSLLALLATSLATPAWAQNRRNPQREAVELTGTLKDMGPGLLQIEAANGDIWLVQVANRPQEISYVGTAEPDWMRAGLWVRFQSHLTFQRKVQADGPVTELTVVTPSEEQLPGIAPISSLGDHLFSDEPEQPATNKREPIPCTVVGRIVNLKKNKMTVAAADVALTVEVVDDVRIAVQLAELSVAQAGDQVTIRGWKLPMVPGRAVAHTVLITSDKPLTGARPKRGRGSAEEKNKKDGEASSGRDSGAADREGDEDHQNRED